MESILQFLLDNIEIISSFILGIGALSPFLMKAKKITKELGDILVTISKALEDKKLTKEEIQSIVKEFKDIIEVFKKK